MKLTIMVNSQDDQTSNAPVAHIMFCDVFCVYIYAIAVAVFDNFLLK